MCCMCHHTISEPLECVHFGTPFLPEGPLPAFTFRLRRKSWLLMTISPDFPENFSTTSDACAPYLTMRKKKFTKRVSIVFGTIFSKLCRCQKIHFFWCARCFAEAACTKFDFDCPKLHLVRVDHRYEGF